MFSLEIASELVLNTPKVFGDPLGLFAKSAQRPARRSARLLLRAARATIVSANSAGRLTIRPVGDHSLVAIDDHSISLDELTGPPSDDAFYLSIFQRGFAIFGHWLIDIIPRMIAASRLVGCLYPVRFIIPQKVPEFALELLRQAGFHASALVPVEEVIGREITLITMPSLREHDYFHDHLSKRVFAAFAEKTRPPGPSCIARRIYLSRSAWKGGVIGPKSRALLNRLEVEATFRDAGFEVVIPEHLPIAEQISLISGADVLAGEGGSALHHSVFLRPGSTVVAIQSGRQDHFIQASLCGLMGQHSIYVGGQTESFDWRANFSASLGDIGSAIAGLAGPAESPFEVSFRASS